MLQVRIRNSFSLWSNWSDPYEYELVTANVITILPIEIGLNPSSSEDDPLPYIYAFAVLGVIGLVALPLCIWLTCFCYRRKKMVTKSLKVMLLYS